MNNILQNNIFELQVNGIKCTKCAAKITGKLKDYESVKKVNVNVIAEKVQVTIGQKDDIEKIVNLLNEMNFKVISEPTEIIFDRTEESRTIEFQFSECNQKQIDTIIFQLQQETGILKTKYSINTKIIQIIYNPEVIKGRNIFDFINNLKQNFLVHDPYLDVFRTNRSHKKGISITELITSLAIVGLFMIFSMFFPLFDFFRPVMLFPQTFGIFSLYLLFMMLMAALTIYLYGIQTFKNAWTNFYQYRSLNMETLITLGSGAAILMTFYLIIIYLLEEGGLESEDEKIMKIQMIVHMMESASLILGIVNVGKYFEGKAKETIVQMSNDIFPEDQLIKNNMLTYIEPKNRKFQIDKMQEYEVSLIDKGDLILLKAPMKLLVDGVIIHTYGEKEKQLNVIDSVCYGWDDAFSPSKGERLKSGAEIISGEAIMQIESTIENSMLSKISTQINVAQNESESHETGISIIFKNLSDHFVKAVIFFAFFVMSFWIIRILTNSVHTHGICKWCFPFERAISVLVASCPCALGLAIPSVIVITLNLAMKNQLLIKKNNTFEKVHNIGAVAFDKTGTLFTKVTEIKDLKKIQSDNFEDDLEEDDLWHILSLIEKDSKHPIAEVLYKESIKRISSIDIKYKLFGKVQFQKTGVRAELIATKGANQNPLEVVIGNIKQMQNNNVEINQYAQAHLEIAQQQGKTSLLVGIKKKVLYIISLDNTSNLRPEAKEVIQYLQNNLKLEVFILSGDAKETVEQVGYFLEIPQENLIGDTSAEGKRFFLKKYREDNKKEVMMIGDGLNDILSIQEAGVGVSINAKSELNLVASDVVALNENLWRVISLFKLMKYTRIFIICNLIWTFSYNLVMMPIAAGFFNFSEHEISPFLASIAMSGSSLVVVSFSNIMRCFDFNLSQNKPSINQTKTMKNQSSRKRKMIGVSSAIPPKESNTNLFISGHTQSHSEQSDTDIERDTLYKKLLVNPQSDNDLL